MIYIVSRHPGALQWLQSRFDEPVTHLAHLTEETILCADDCIAGILPANKIAELNRRGIRYFHLCIDIPEILRGTELSAAILENLGAQLKEFYVHQVLPDEAILEVHPYPSREEP